MSTTPDQAVTAPTPLTDGECTLLAERLLEGEPSSILDALTPAQKAVVSLWLLPTYEAIDMRGRPGTGRLEAKYPASGEEFKDAAKMAGIGHSAVETAVRVQKRNPSVIEQMRAGSINLSEAARAVGLARGFHSRVRLGPTAKIRRDSMGRGQPTPYGKGDRWREVSGPMQRYLTAWEKRGFEYRHLNPREARARLKAIDEIIAGLEKAKADLEPRAHSASLKVPSNNSQKG